MDAYKSRNGNVICWFRTRFLDKWISAEVTWTWRINVGTEVLMGSFCLIWWSFSVQNMYLVTRIFFSIYLSTSDISILLCEGKIKKMWFLMRKIQRSWWRKQVQKQRSPVFPSVLWDTQSAPMKEILHNNVKNVCRQNVLFSCLIKLSKVFKTSVPKTPAA